MVAVISIVLREGEADDDAGRRVLDIHALDAEISATTADGRHGRFTVTEDWEVIDGRKCRIYRHIPPDDAPPGEDQPHRDTRSLLHYEAALARGAEVLAKRYRGSFPSETVLRTVKESYETLARTARITVHLPNLALHHAANRLAEEMNRGSGQ